MTDEPKSIEFDGGRIDPATAPTILAHQLQLCQMLFEAIPLGREHQTIEVLMRLGACPFVIKAAHAYIEAMLDIYMHRKRDKIEFEDPPLEVPAPAKPKRAYKPRKPKPDMSVAVTDDGLEVAFGPAFRDKPSPKPKPTPLQQHAAAERALEESIFGPITTVPEHKENEDGQNGNS